MTAATRTLQRLERILVMVPWLLDHPGVTVDEVTRRFGVSRQDLAGDLDVLGYCGLPGYGGGDLVEASIVGDRVCVRMADFFRRPLRLSLQQALTLLLAAHALAGVGGLPESQDLRSAAAKLEAALGTGGSGTRTGRPAAEASGAPRLAIDLRAPGDEHLPELRSAIAESRIVHLVYRSGSKAEITQRDVEPWALIGAQGAWYLQGWCRLAEGPRDFRLDRIRDLRLTPECVERPRAPQPVPPAYRPGPDDLRVVLELDPPAWWVCEWAVVDAVEEPDPTTRRITLRTPALEWAVLLVLRLGEHVRVVAPDRLAREVRERARRALERYRT
ncbi:MAG: WYL domain-containing protein [Actinomycetota bacterium]|nr:WYL domain-containing protein [Actinomycetota bacterium]